MIRQALDKYMEENQIFETKLCKIGWWVLSLSDEDKKEVDALLHDTPMTGKEISEFLRTVGVKFSTETIRKHRMKECICQTPKMD